MIAQFTFCSLLMKDDSQGLTLQLKSTFPSWRTWAIWGSVKDLSINRTESSLNVSSTIVIKGSQILRNYPKEIENQKRAMQDKNWWYRGWLLQAKVPEEFSAAIRAVPSPTMIDKKYSDNLRKSTSNTMSFTEELHNHKLQSVSTLIQYYYSTLWPASLISSRSALGCKYCSHSSWQALN